jgi:phthalate 4,5-dioxygenase
MLSHADNMLMCRVTGDAPMGKAVKRYWISLLSSGQLPEPDCDPVRVEAVGEKLVAFRNSDGIVGVLDEQCCHRSASLALGRCEGGGIRCIFHGWKFAPDGTVMETPNVSDPKFRERVRARAFPAREAGGFIWAYLGPKELEPPFPHWRYFDYPPERRLTVTLVIQANFVQVQEALLDSSHLTILHQDAFARKTDVEIDFASNVVNVAAKADPVVEAEETTFGFHYAALRPKQTDQGLMTEARVTGYVAPFHCVNANGDLVGIIVPIDDERSLHHFVWWSDDKEIAHDPQRAEILKFTGLSDEILEKTGLAFKTWREPGKPNRDNNFLQDREAMRKGAFTGLPIFFPEDAAVLVSSGGIRDRSKEMLAPADLAIARLYRTLLGVVRKNERGEEPTGLTADMMKVRGLHDVVAEGQTWRSLVPDHVAPAPAAPTSIAAAAV